MFQLPIPYFFGRTCYLTLSLGRLSWRKFGRPVGSAFLVDCVLGGFRFFMRQTQSNRHVVRGVC